MGEDQTLTSSLSGRKLTIAHDYQLVRDRGRRNIFVPRKYDYVDLIFMH